MRGDHHVNIRTGIKGAAPRPQTDSKPACGVLGHQLSDHFKNRKRQARHTKARDHKKLAAVLKIPHENLMAAAGHITAFPEEIREASESYQSIYAIYQTAVTRGTENLSLFNSEKWRHLSKQDIENLSKYFDFLASEAKKRSSST